MRFGFHGPFFIHANRMCVCVFVLFDVTCEFCFGKFMPQRKEMAKKECHYITRLKAKCMRQNETRWIYLRKMRMAYGIEWLRKWWFVADSNPHACKTRWEATNYIQKITQNDGIKMKNKNRCVRHNTIRKHMRRTQSKVTKIKRKWQTHCT